MIFVNKVENGGVAKGTYSNIPSAVTMYNKTNVLSTLNMCCHS